SQLHARRHAGDLAGLAVGDIAYADRRQRAVPGGTRVRTCDTRYRVVTRYACTRIGRTIATQRHTTGLCDRAVTAQRYRAADTRGVFAGGIRAEIHVVAQGKCIVGRRANRVVIADAVAVGTVDYARITEGTGMVTADNRSL